MDSSSGLCQLDNVIISDKLQLSNGSVITTGNCVAGALIFTPYKSNKKLIVSEDSELTIEGNIEQLSGGSDWSGYHSDIIVNGSLNVNGNYQSNTRYSRLYLQNKMPTMFVKGNFSVYEGTFTDDIILVGGNYSNKKFLSGTILVEYNKENAVGDVNNDGIINNVDVAELLKEISNGISFTETDLNIYDINKDEKIDLLDSIIVAMISQKLVS